MKQLLPLNKKPSKKAKQLGIFFTLLLIIISIFSYLTNPFTQYTLVADPYNKITIEDGQLTIQKDSEIAVKQNAFVHQLVKIKSAWHIVSSRYFGGKPAESHTVDEIIAEIHQDRFNPQQPFIISGDHFSMLYPRSLGIFYHSLLDDRTALSQTDWENRQIMYLKTVAYASDVFSKSGRLSTTIVPVGKHGVALMNISAPPSDTLYSLLFAYQQLLDNEYQRVTYPYDNGVEYPQMTQSATQQLLAEYSASLTAHYADYKSSVYDETTGLIKEDILLSGTKDMMKKYGGFYDNVMFWKTTQLAGELGLIEQDDIFLSELKTRIIDNFWQEEAMLFVEDLSTEAQENEWYSSDWLIAFQTGFLDPSDTADREYLLKSVEYIRRNAIDKPFAIQYHPDMRGHRIYQPMRISTPEYGSTTIWSNWGMEYTKLLIRLHQTTVNTSYIDDATRHLDAYTFNIKRYQGYPEVYDQHGDFYRKKLYKSIRQTGWIVTYEQAREMLAATKREN